METELKRFNLDEIDQFLIGANGEGTLFMNDVTEAQVRCFSGKDNMCGCGGVR